MICNKARYNFGTNKREKIALPSLSDTKQSTYSFDFQSSGPVGQKITRSPSRHKLIVEPRTIVGEHLQSGCRLAAN